MVADVASDGLVARSSCRVLDPAMIGQPRHANLVFLGRREQGERHSVERFQGRTQDSNAISDRLSDVDPQVLRLQSHRPARGQHDALVHILAVGMLAYDGVSAWGNAPDSPVCLYLDGCPGRLPRIRPLERQEKLEPR